jgi:hypothetical protein
MLLLEVLMWKTGKPINLRARTQLMTGGDHCLALIELSTLLDSLSFVGMSLDHLMEQYPV